MLHGLNNTPAHDAAMPIGPQRLMREARVMLAECLPAGWAVTSAPRSSGGPDTADDGAWEVTAPDGRRATFRLQVKATVEPRAAVQLVDRLRLRGDAAAMVIARHIGSAAGATLAAANVSYIDLTGNVHVQHAEPGLVIRTEGASKDPARTPRAVASLRGARVAAIVRDLIEHRAPGTLRDISVRTGADVGHVSRVLSFLDAMALVSRSSRGELRSVAWPALLERWATDAPLRARGTASRFLAPRGIDELIRRLPTATGYAVTGSLAASLVAPIAPTRLARIYTADAQVFATAMGLRAADAGANVVLVDVDHELALRPGVRPDWHGHHDGVVYASPVNVVADLLTGAGREPDEGAELLGWMRADEEAWRA